MERRERGIRVNCKRQAEVDVPKDLLEGGLSAVTTMDIDSGYGVPQLPRQFSKIERIACKDDPTLGAIKDFCPAVLADLTLLVNRDVATHQYPS